MTRPFSLAADELLPAPPALAGLLGAPGLHRGSTIVVDGSVASGGTSLVFLLLSAASQAGAWCAVVNLPGLGIAAAEELGVCLDHLVVVPSPKGRFVSVVGTLLEGCDVVVGRPPGVVSRREAGRLKAKARERRSTLVVVGGAIGVLDEGSTSPGSSRLGPPSGCIWPEVADIRLEVTRSWWLGIGCGSGRLVAHGIEVVSERRRAAPREQRGVLWLQEPPEEGQGALEVREVGESQATGMAG